MDSAKDVLDHAARLAPQTSFTLESLERKRARREGGRRVRTIAVALGLAAIAVGSAVVALREPASVVGSPAPTQTLPPAGEAPQVAGPGQFYYRAVLLASGGCTAGREAECDSTGTRLDMASWWNDRNEGRLVVDQRVGYGIAAGEFGPGEFPNTDGIDVSDWPLDPEELTRFLLDRSAEEGASPAPLVTPPPDGAPNDGQLWRAITDLIVDPQVTPAVRAALLDVAAGLQGSHVRTDVVDPAGRSAHVIEFGSWGGEVPERLYVEPRTHELLAWTQSSTVDPDAFSIYLAQDVGVVSGTDVAPDKQGRSVPLTVLSADDLVGLLPRD